MTLTEQETKRRRINGLFLIVLDCGVAHHRPEQVNALPRVEKSGFRCLLQDGAALRSRVVQIFAAAKVVRRGDQIDAFGGSFRDFLMGCVSGKK